MLILNELLLYIDRELFYLNVFNISVIILITFTSLMFVVDSIQFISRYNRQDGEGKGKISITMTKMLIFVLIGMVYINGGFELNKPFLAPFEDFGFGLLKLMQFHPLILMLMFMMATFLLIFYIPWAIYELIILIKNKEILTKRNELDVCFSVILLMSLTNITILYLIAEISS